MSAYGLTTNKELNALYSKPHYYYKVFRGTNGKPMDEEVFGSVDKKRAEEVFNETNGDYVELAQFNHGDFVKIIKAKEN